MLGTLTKTISSYYNNIIVVQRLVQMNVHYKYNGNKK